MSLTFWFDVHSPWCYLASFRIGDLARRHDLDLIWRPLHLPRLQQRISGRQPLNENAAFVAWYRQDLEDWAALQGLPLVYHPQYPLRNSRALRACQYAEDEERGEAFTKRVMQGYWAEKADISDLDVLASYGIEAGCNGDGIREAAVSEWYKARIEANTEDAIGRGVFGVPTVDTGSKLYFGNDRLELLEFHLTAAQGLSL